jgi:hypothetical protein
MPEPLCRAAPIPPLPLPNATLFSLFLFIRHGTRTPTLHEGWPAAQGNWHCGNRYSTSVTRVPVANGVPYSFAFNASAAHAFKPSCHAGSLTDTGFDDQTALGAAYRGYLVNTTRLLPPEFDPELVSVRSSWLPRAIESATVFVNALFPPKNEGETITIVTGTPSTHDPLVPLIDNQDEFSTGFHEFVHSEPMASRVPEAKRLYQPLFEKYNISSREDMDYLTIADLFFPYQCGNGELSEGLTDELWRHMLGNILAVEDGYARRRLNVTYRPMLALISGELREQLAGRKKAKFMLLSGHDLTITTFLAGLGYNGLREPPPYASHLAFEVWQRDGLYVRLALNGEVLVIKGRGLIPIGEFLGEADGGEL